MQKDKVYCLGVCYQEKAFTSECYLYIYFNILPNLILYNKLLWKI